jgi:CBS domain-containing protein
MKEGDVISASAEEIMTPFVIMLEIDATFKDVIKILIENNISAVFIHEVGKEEYYIISQTDIVNYLNDYGISQKNLADIPVSKFMQGPIDMLEAQTPVDKMIRFMTKHKYKRVLIEKEGKPVGVVSTRDIMIWNNTYFKAAKPQILLYMDNVTGIFIAKHFFKSNISDKIIREDLIDLYGGALKSISIITDEVIKESGNIRHLIKDKRSILFEPYQDITGILVCDYNSIELRRELRKATKKFAEIHSKVIQRAIEKKDGVNIMLDIRSVIPIFEKKK